MRILILAMLLINKSAGVPLNNDRESRNKCIGKSTYTVWVSSCGLSACSGNTGCGGSPMGTQPSDLLMAWLSFLAGDFCELGKTNNALVSFAILLTAVTVLE